MSDFYSGSYILSPFVSVTGLTVDKLNFIVCQLIAIAFGRPFQKYFPATPGSSNITRYAVSLIVGTSLCLFCFGHQIVHLLIQGSACLLLMRYVDKQYARFLCCIFAIVYLSVCHLMRQYYDYGGYTLDITGPLMISTQRLSTLAFNVYDGSVLNGDNEADKARLTPRQRQHHVRDLPSLLEFYAYLLHFQGILIGPFVFYVDFKNYMDGTMPQPEGMSKEQHKQHLSGTGRMLVVAKWTLFFAAVTLAMQNTFTIQFLGEKEFQSYSLLSKLVYLTLSSFVIRQRYYFAWSLGELSYLSSGCGFTGVNEKTGQPEYKTVQNFDFTGVELATSMKLSIDNWNISTVHWLRECVYERVPSKYAILAVFVASATWHGFYPGYYLLFISIAFFTTVARLVSTKLHAQGLYDCYVTGIPPIICALQARRHLRPLFLHSASLKRAYDVVTGVAAITTLNYGAGAFGLLELSKGLQFWWSMYFIVHLVAIAMYLGFLILAPRQSARSGGQNRQAEVCRPD